MGARSEAPVDGAADCDSGERSKTAAKSVSHGGGGGGVGGGGGRACVCVRAVMRVRACMPGTIYCMASASAAAVTVAARKTPVER